MSLYLSQAEANALIAMEKHTDSKETYRLPDLGGGVTVPLMSADGNEPFLLDVHRSRINLSKGKFQNRARTTIVLVRVDIGGAPHRNPDGQEIDCPHIHLYREGYGDKWAYSLPADKFRNPTSHWDTLYDFLAYCNVTKLPYFEKGLFT